MLKYLGYNGMDSEVLVKTFGRDSTPMNAEGSRQVFDNLPLSAKGWDSSEIIPPPHDPLLWAHMLEKSTRLQALVKAKAQNVCGHGWEIVPTKEVREGKKLSRRAQRKFDRDKATLERLLSRPNDKMPFTEILTRMKVDETATGNGYLEVVSDEKGVPVKLFHVPSHTIRVLKNGKGFVQIRDGVKVYFRNFGDVEPMDYKTGVRGKDVDPENMATELLSIEQYSPRDSFYGVPSHVSAAAAIAGNYLSAQRNVVFFENDAVPRMAVIVEGGHLSSASAEYIRNFLNTESKGVENAHRTMVLETQSKSIVGMGGSEGPKIRLERLNMMRSDDASFQKYRENNDEEIREAFRMHKVFLGTTTDTNRASALVGRQVTNEQVFSPDQKALEYKLNHLLVPRLGLTGVEIRLKSPQVSDAKEMSEIYKNYSTISSMTINEIRQERGMQKIDKDWADLPAPLALSLFSSKVVEEQEDPEDREKDPDMDEDGLEDDAEVETFEDAKMVVEEIRDFLKGFDSESV